MRERAGKPRRGPSQVLKYTAGEINYGGRVTDDWDRRCIMSILEDFYKPEVLTPEWAYSESGIYKQISASSDLDVSTRVPNCSPQIQGPHRRAKGMCCSLSSSPGECVFAGTWGTSAAFRKLHLFQATGRKS